MSVPVRLTVSVVAVAASAFALSACGSKPGATASSVANNVSSAVSSARVGASSVSSAASSVLSSASAALSSASSAASSAVSGGALKACMVLDTGGINDKSFNQSSYQGMIDAKKSNPSLSISYVPSNSGNDYKPNLNAEVGNNCDPVIGVGGLMSGAVASVAKANPNVHFAEVDAASSAPNVYGLQFNTAQGAFLGGYLAAGMTKTGKVATWGGMNIPPVTIYMDGFWEGVQYFNKQNHKSVQVLGWNEKNPKNGTFSNSFTDENGGQQISQTLIQEGADVIFPVAGGAGLGAGAAAQASNGQANVIWVDTDGCVSAAQYCKYFITSVTKNLAGSVKTYLDAAATGNFPTGSYVGTLKNNGTGLAPFHQWASKVPSSLKSQLAQVKQGIISGKIKITSPSQPSS